MNSNTRLIVNTLAQNIRTIINIVLSLYSTRIVMQALGQSDYGIYMLVAGIVSLLSYLSNTLVITTQRYLSFTQGKGDREELRYIFANSYLLHWILGIALAVCCLGLTEWIFNGLGLNIPSDRLEEAKIVYLLVITSVFFTFIASPFRALLIAHENIVYISLVDLLDGILKLGLVFTLFLVENWRLSLYATIITGVMLFNLIALAAYGKLHYNECVIIPRISLWRDDIQRKIIGFATWTLYGMIAIYVRNQGLAVALNKFIGTLANAAYGIANQVFGSIQFLSQAILNAIAPQIMGEEGAGNRARAIHLSFLASKYCFLIFSMVCIPLVFEMPSILRIWLGDVPEHAVLFTDMMLIASLCDQITIGFGKLNQAIGKIRNYTLITFSIKVLTLPFIIWCLRSTWGIHGAAGCFILFELGSAIIRLPILMTSAGVNATAYAKEVLLRILLPTLGIILTCWSIGQLIPESNFRFLLTGFLSVIIGVLCTYLFAMTQTERQGICRLIMHKKP